MKKTLAILCGCSLNMTFAAEFIHPLDFDNSAEQKTQVIEYIKQRVKKTIVKA